MVALNFECLLQVVMINPALVAEMCMLVPSVTAAGVKNKELIEVGWRRKLVRDAG